MRRKKPSARSDPSSSDFENRLPIYAGSIGPEAFEIVHFPHLGRENMDHHIPVILHDPLALVVAIHPFTLIAGDFELFVDFLRDGNHLAAAGAGADHKEIKDGRDRGEIENEGFIPTKTFRNASAPAGFNQTFADSFGSFFTGRHQFRGGGTIGVFAGGWLVGDDGMPF